MSNVKEKEISLGDVGLWVVLVRSKKIQQVMRRIMLSLER